jgi:hypothetical protein
VAYTERLVLANVTLYLKSVMLFSYDFILFCIVATLMLLYGIYFALKTSLLKYKNFMELFLFFSFI